MSKYCPLDFYGGAIANEPLIGVFPNQHLVEFSLDVEWQGRTFVPVRHSAVSPTPLGTYQHPFADSTTILPCRLR